MRREEVVKAMAVIQEWCENRDALEDCRDGCPMAWNCKWAQGPSQWEIEE